MGTSLPVHAMVMWRSCWQVESWKVLLLRALH